ncbi:hypothetical protein [Pseudalkalibacillus berkeleyi]|uniref:Uncharacterized protein n=1 Tax=Pseudalkalibacillus berkeleyi TaxID=1069813 RepID=A0ABS9H377_9BACL|nr:hypothetical protein [Pseudalkalibacillus berkeleyi]MCF6138275.1 hypothetical protein [Pseudalkalibacillus berkeleyi]
MGIIFLILLCCAIVACSATAISHYDERQPYNNEDSFGFLFNVYEDSNN